MNTNTYVTEVSMTAVKVGIMGVGTVGRGTIELLTNNRCEIEKKLEKRIELLIVASRNIFQKNILLPTHTIITEDIFEVVDHPEVEVVVELIGGSAVAKEAVLQAIKNGKHVITANKKLLAEYGNEIFAAAEANKVMVKFEASVAGGIPIIKVLRESLAANHIAWIAGIINGTSNFILSKMKDRGASFEAALAEAQQLGYAEADPTFDVDGQDAGHKITLLSALAFGIPIDFSYCYLEGITHLQNEDIRYANELGYEVKLLSIAKKTPAGIELRVHPTLIPQSHLLSQVAGVMNAVCVKGNVVGELLCCGAGAGAAPTASAVAADLMDLVRELVVASNGSVPQLAYLTSEIKSLPILSIREIQTSYYLRISVRDEIGVLSRLTKILVAHDVSIEVMLQKLDSVPGAAQIVVLTHRTIEENIRKVVGELEALSSVLRPVVLIRSESFH
ncbi:MAG: homoserine dehydrogenase [Neisseriaceae bacterium]